MKSLKYKNIFYVIFMSLQIEENCLCLKILAVFPYNGRSHHILFSSLVAELCNKKHNVTVVNYFPVENNLYLRQISIQGSDSRSDCINVEDHINKLPWIFTNFYRAYDAAMAFKYMANENCEKLMLHKELQTIIASGETFDLVIAEQFETDCGLAIAYKLSVPTVGMTAHILMPWTYSRLGAPDHPANVIQKENQDIVNRVYPDVPNLELLGRNMSLMLVNQYFSLTGSRLYGSNLIEIGGMHINKKAVEFRDNYDDIQTFLDNAKKGVVYISFGTVASQFPRHIIDTVIKLTENMDMTFVWKIDNITEWIVPHNVLLKQWLPQPAILCHPNVVAFISHSGMLNSTEAMHCGVPIVSVPIFGDQPTNAALAVENGLGVTVDIRTRDEYILQQALETVLQKRFQDRANQLSRIWQDRPMSPMDTAVFWIEFAAKYKGIIDLKPPTLNIHMYEYLLLDVYFILGLLLATIVYLVFKILSCILNIRKSIRQEKVKSE